MGPYDKVYHQHYYHSRCKFTPGASPFFLPEESITLENIPSADDMRNHQGGGIQDVKFIPGNPDTAALATAVHLGQVWIIYPFREDENGKQGVAQLLYDLGPKARDTTAI